MGRRLVSRVQPEAVSDNLTTLSPNAILVQASRWFEGGSVPSRPNAHFHITSSPVFLWDHWMGYENRVIVFPYYSYICPRLEHEISALTEENYTVDVYMWDRNREITTNNQERYNVIPVRQWAPDRIERNRIWSILLLPIYYIHIWSSVNPDNYDIAFSPHPFMLPLSLIMFHHGTIIYDSREMYEIKLGQLLPGPLEVLGKIIFKSFENQLIARCDGISVVDSKEDHLYERYSKLNKNTEVIYNVPSNNTKFNQNQIKNLEQTYEANFLVAYVGGISEAKGCIKMIEGLVKLQRSDVKLLFIGHFVDSELEIKKRVKSYGIEEKIEFTGRLPYNSMMHHLKIADVGLALHQPNQYHRNYPSAGTGRKFFTYMQAGLPIIGPDFGEVGKIIEDTGCGILVDSTDVSSICEGIEFLISNPGKRAMMGQEGKDAIDEKYNWDTEKRNFLRMVSNAQRHGS